MDLHTRACPRAGISAGAGVGASAGAGPRQPQLVRADQLPCVAGQDVRPGGRVGGCVRAEEDFYLVA